MNLKIKWVLLFCLVSMGGCTYSRIVNESEWFGCGCWSPSKKQIAFVRSYDIHRNATGLAAFPDGGMPKYLHKSLSMYVFDTETKKVKKIADVEGRLNIYPPMVRISWRDNLIAYWLSSTRGPDNEGIFILNSDGSNKRLLVADGEMPDISPDAKKVVYQMGNQVWLINVDGTKDHRIKKIPDIDLAYTLWKENGESIILYSQGGVYELILNTMEIKKSELPYQLYFGNTSNLPDTKHITNKEWEVPSPPKKAWLPF